MHLAVPDAEPIDRPRRDVLLRGRGPWLLIAFATLAGPLLWGGGDALRALGALPAAALIAPFAACVAGWLARAAKLQLLLRRIDLARSAALALRVTLASEFGFAATPAGVGGYFACVHYLRAAGVNTTTSSMLIALEQLLDLVFFVVVLPVVALSLPRPLAQSGVFVPALCMGCALILAVLWWFRSAWIDRIEQCLQRSHPETAIRLAHWRAEGFRITRGGTAWLALPLVCTVLQWLARYAVLPLALAGLGVHVSYAHAFVAQALVLHLAQWTGVPGGGRGAELGLGLLLVGSTPVVDFAAGLLLWRLASFHAAILAGLLAIAWPAPTLGAGGAAALAWSDPASGRRSHG